jgi:hypothetical protein
MTASSAPAERSRAECSDTHRSHPLRTAIVMTTVSRAIGSSEDDSNAALSRVKLSSKAGYSAQRAAADGR